MSFTVTIPGSPPSGNHATKIGKGYRRGGISYPKIVKTAEAEAYQQAAALIVRAAVPKGWKWRGGQVITVYRLYLAQEADATNIIKVVEDAVFPALGINDKYAMPCTVWKQIVPAKEARVEVTIEEVNP